MAIEWVRFIDRTAAERVEMQRKVDGAGAEDTGAMMQMNGGKSIMNEGQKKRHIGKGMKPRGNQRFKPQKETKIMQEKSTTEGQQTPVEEVILDPQEGNETPGNIGPENGEKSLQNLEENGAIVAHDDGLEAALKESAGEVVDAEFREVDESPELTQVLGEPAGTDLKTAMAVGTGTVSELIPEPQPPLGGKAFPILGLQPDGSKKYAVEVGEGYWTAVEDWAQSDGITPEEWLRNLLYGAISTYGEPAKGR